MYIPSVWSGIPFLGWVVCRPVLKTLTLFQTKIYDFPYPLPDLTLKMHTLFQTLWGVVISATLNGFRAYGTSWRPKRCSRFFSSRSMSTATHVTLKMVSQTKQTECTPYFRHSNAEVQKWKMEKAQRNSGEMSCRNNGNTAFCFHPRFSVTQGDSAIPHSAF